MDKEKAAPPQWFNTSMCRSIEARVSEHIGRRWGVRRVIDLSDLACHPCAILSDDSFPVFVKYSHHPSASEQFNIEIEGLQYLAKHAGVMIPAPIAVIPTADGMVLIMEGLNAVSRTPNHWRQIGKILAQIHQSTSNRHGFHKDGYWGPLHQDNTPSADWATFFIERRFLPQLRVAIDSGHLPASLAANAERLLNRLPELCGGNSTPTLLHGDAQQNNFISTDQGTYVIDPALFYGNREFDMALIDAWQPVPNDVFDAYQEEMPLDSSFFERRSLWRIPLYLAGVAIEGSVHLNRLKSALDVYV